MNRLESVDLALDGRIFSASQATRTNQQNSQRHPAHRFFIPLHYEKNYAYPLLVWLHGPSAREGELSQVMQHISVRNYVGMSLRGVVPSEEHESYYTWDQRPSNIENTMEDVLKCVELASQRFNIAANRVFLVGNDVGGTMALRLALSNPGAFAGAVSLGGPMPCDNMPLRAINQARSTPLMIAHCRDSNVYTTDDVCTDLRLLHSAGMKVALRVYPCKQEVTTEMLKDVNGWVMEQISGVPSASYVLSDPTRVRLEDHN